MNHSCANIIVLGRVLIFLLVLPVGSGCATNEEETMVEAATSPLSDLNLVQKKIPEALKQAALEPYALPSDLACDAIESDINELDDVLGLNATPGGNGLASKKENVADTAAVDAVRRTTQGIMPMRDWVRKLTGAEKHSQEVSGAISAGLMRRSFLKGYFVAKGCVEDEEDGASEE